MNTIIVLLLLATIPPPPCANPPRSQAVVQQFKKTNPCPKMCMTYVFRNGKFTKYETCGACEVDHICPLACCGLDAVQNMQWLDKKANREKGADCTKCQGGK